MTATYGSRHIAGVLPEVPGPKGLPFFGVAPNFMRNPLQYLEGCVQEYGPIFRLPIGGTKITLVNTAELAGTLMGSEFQNFRAAESAQKAMEPMLGHCIATNIEAAPWQNVHDQMLPMFTPKMLRRYFEVTVDAMQDEMDVLDKHAASGEPIGLYHTMRHGMITSLTRTMFVRGLGEDEIPDILAWFTSANNYISARYLTNCNPLIMAIPAVRRGKKDMAKINARALELIQARRRDPSDEAEDMLDVLLDAKGVDGAPYTDQQVLENMVALWFGGQETTPSITTWAFGLLASNPEVRERLFAEVDEVLGDRRPTFGDLTRLDYTSGLIDEAMRLYPPFTFIGRESLKDQELGGYKISKGEQLAYVGWTIHREEANWPDPERVIPERHFAKERKSRDRAAFVSFGFGKRRCLGERVGRMESTLMVAMAAQRFWLDHADGKLPEPIVQNSIKPKNGMPMLVRRR